MSDSLLPRPSDSSDSSLQIQQELEGDRNQVIGQSVNSTVLSAEVINLTVYDRPPILRRHLPARTAKFTDKRDAKIKKVLLNKVKKYWIQGVLEKSLYNTVLIELRLEERVDAVQDPFKTFQALPNESKTTLLKNRDISDIFIEMGEGRTLLILGEPGAGKTITLLRLAKDLITRTEEDLNYPIPVVFNLSSWIYKRQSIISWLIEELGSKYDVSRKLGKELVINQQLLLLLDGLDEVKIDCRESCVQAINQFIQQYGQTEVVICSRLKDYEELPNQLKLQSAIYLQSLTTEQLYEYFNEAGDQLNALRTIFYQNAVLQELAKTPLMLSIMSLAYQNKSIEEVPNAGSLGEYSQQLFDAYIEQMLKRKEAIFHVYGKEKFMNWLVRLAWKMSQESQTVFLIEQVQPSWLQSKNQKFIYRIGVILISGLIGCLGGGLSFGVSGGLVIQQNFLTWKFSDALNWFQIGTLMGALCGVIILGLGAVKIEPVETLDISVQNILQYLINSLTTYRNLVGAVIGPLIIGLSAALLDRKKVVILGDNLTVNAEDKLSLGIFFGVFLGLSFYLVLGIINGLKGSNIDTKVVPNQGIWKSAINASLLGLIGGMIGGMIGGGFGVLVAKIYFGSVENSIQNLSLMFLLSFGVVFGTIGGLFNEASKACLRHIVLRLIFYCSGCFPWNFYQFLEYARNCVFLQKVGGGYIFSHKLLLEYLAYQFK